MTITVIVMIGLIIGAFVLGRSTAPAATGVDADRGELPMRAGIPLPNRHSAAGAATAAADFQIAGFRVSVGTLNPTTADGVFLAPNASDAAKQVLAAPMAPVDQLSQQRVTFAPLSLVIRSYTASHAVVQVWGVAATSSRITPHPAGTADWSSTTMTLTWTGSQWRVVDQHYTPGPWPARADERMAVADGDFSFRYRELTSSGWSYVPEP
ncbi:MAG TPA: hypothetical protein VFW65_21910 [Pseudonocardiaceae bacterium]|nr:hypothetical protein [Pseudonocardiaceae bacterium]